MKKPDAGAVSVVGNVIWLLLFGWWLALSHVITAVLLAITIIGIPLAIANFKLIPMALWPFGHEVVSAQDATEGFGERQPSP